MNTSNPGSCPAGKKDAGDYHTHGGPDPRFASGNEGFSMSDKKSNDDSGKPGFLGTPSGMIKKYVPNGDPRHGYVILIGSGAK